MLSGFFSNVGWLVSCVFENRRKEPGRGSGENPDLGMVIGSLGKERR